MITTTEKPRTPLSCAAYKFFEGIPIFGSQFKEFIRHLSAILQLAGKDHIGLAAIDLLPSFAHIYTHK